MAGEEDVVRKGMLKLRGKGGMFSKSQTEMLAVLRRASGNGKARLELFDEKTSRNKGQQPPKRSVILSSCASCAPVPSTGKGRDRNIHGQQFCLGLDSGAEVLTAPSSDEMQSWVTDICRLAEFPTAVAPSSAPGMLPPPLPTSARPRLIPGAQAASTEVTNATYVSAGDMEYRVEVLTGELADRLSLTGPCSCVLSAGAIELAAEAAPDNRWVWPLPLLRRYGLDESRFYFEGGRRCRSGPGLLKFERAADSQEIFARVDRLSKEGQPAAASRSPGQSPLAMHAAGSPFLDPEVQAATGGLKRDWERPTRMLLTNSPHRSTPAGLMRLGSSPQASDGVASPANRPPRADSLASDTGSVYSHLERSDGHFGSRTSLTSDLTTYDTLEFRPTPPALIPSVPNNRVYKFAQVTNYGRRVPHIDSDSGTPPIEIIAPASDCGPQYDNFDATYDIGRPRLQVMKVSANNTPTGSEPHYHEFRPPSFHDNGGDSTAASPPSPSDLPVELPELYDDGQLVGSHSDERYSQQSTAPTVVPSPPCSPELSGTTYDTMPSLQPRPSAMQLGHGSNAPRIAVTGTSA